MAHSTRNFWQNVDVKMLPLCILLAFVTTTTALLNAYILQLSENHQFHKRASHLSYTVRHEFSNPDIFLGISIQGNITEAQLQEIPGVISISIVYNVSLPFQNSHASTISYEPALPIARNGLLASSLEMTGVDRLHQLGIKGKGIKIGVIDTGVDYRHPALGNGFGPGYKIAGGYSFVLGNGSLSNNPDPLTTCYGGGHGTHVSGIIGMEPATFNVTGVAPESSIFMYRVFDCSGHAGSDTIMAAMSKAYDDGVDLVSMSLGLGPASFSGAIDPLAVITKKLTDRGIAVIVAQGNDANGSSATPELYTEEWPSTEPTSISVGAISNTHFPLVYSATDNFGSIQYASVYPLDFPNGADVYIIDDGCDPNAWSSAQKAIRNLNQTIVAFKVTPGCPATAAGPATVSHIMALNSDTTNPYLSAYDTPSQGFFGTAQFINLNSIDGAILQKNFAAAGGYLKYKLFFANKDFISVPQKSGGMVDYYSSFGPTWHQYDLKPQISAPGGHVLSTWPLGPLGGYAILSGTSMATPYLAGCYALVKSQFPSATIAEILARLQVNAQPVPWIFNESMSSATVQQGAGLVNAFDAIFAETKVFPGQLKISDVNKTCYGLVNLTIENTSSSFKTYSFFHQGAGYMDYYMSNNEKNQVPLFGTAHFPPPATIPPHTSVTIQFTITPPQGVAASALPVFGGFIKIIDSHGETFSVPYAGPPYSLYNTEYIFTQNSSDGILPEVYAYNSDQSVVTYDLGFLEINVKNGYGAAIPTLQWTRAFRVDVLPADTNITAKHYGFDTAVRYDYQPSNARPTEAIFGYPSFGTAVNSTGYVWPGGNSVSASDDLVKRSDGSRYSIGIGDYRWFASILRDGGNPGVQEDHDTWLGPVMRFVGE